MKINPDYQWLAKCGVTGRIGKEVVLKKCGKKIIVTRYPKKSNAPKTQRQTENLQLFKEAVNYAKLMHTDPAIREQYRYKLKRNETVYNVLVREYMQAHKYKPE